VTDDPNQTVANRSSRVLPLPGGSHAEARLFDRPTLARNGRNGGRSSAAAGCNT
jgi:hypothetical protein